MKIHVSGKNKAQIVKILEAAKHIITNKDENNPNANESLASIIAADMAIIELGEPSYCQGFETALCISRKTPVLLLKEKTSKAMYAETVEEEVVEHAEYSANGLEKILLDFVDRATRGFEKTRFNFFIDKKLENYLDWAAHTYQTNKAEIIRDLLNERMLEKDPQYKKYLSK